MVFDLTKKQRPKILTVDSLKWILDHGTADEKRVAKADTNAPILVVEEGGVYYVVDGFHRLTKAVKEDLQFLPVLMVSKEILEKALIDS